MGERSLFQLDPTIVSFRAELKPQQLAIAALLQLGDSFLLGSLALGRLRDLDAEPRRPVAMGFFWDEPADLQDYASLRDVVQLEESPAPVHVGITMTAVPLYEDLQVKPEIELFWLCRRQPKTLVEVAVGLNPTRPRKIRILDRNFADEQMIEMEKAKVDALYRDLVLLILNSRSLNYKIAEMDSIEEFARDLHMSLSSNE